MNGKIGFMSAVALLALAGVALGQADPGFAFEDFNNDGVFNEGDLKLVLPENSKKGADLTLEIANSAAGIAAKAGIVIPQSARRIDAGLGDLGSVSIKSEGKVQIGPNVTIRAGTIELTGTGGVALKRSAVLNGKSSIYVKAGLWIDPDMGIVMGGEGGFECISTTLRSGYIDVTAWSFVKAGWGSRLAAEGYLLLTTMGPGGTVGLDHCVVKGDTQINTRGALVANSIIMASPDIWIQPPDTDGDPFAPTAHSLVKSTINLGMRGGYFYVDAGSEPDTKQLDLTRSLFLGNAYYVTIFANPCILEKTVFRGQHTTDIWP